ncbi:phenylalanine--tRNA ligase subunit beta [Clostridium sp. D2Q-11]|uniref:Phenylalanine--tRNA ligase beta subunit n=1 Tax=Anaeromonas frigoriresistens TaxID=2683708 RepID=A0A942UUZ7_9FIRM|nr:phenylalanine--tRNA ligase subunit beta [Anaeromonas frigoriresistens]MBS4537985.1 phenylalanine--tRNA ligase subunit beta [Anaeromonas frigoriresistens]
MLIPVKWLKDYVNIEGIETRELADKLTMSGSHVDSIDKIDKGVENVVVGKIEEITPHPNADKLVITKINIGEETIQIVTGAKNINEEDYVPVALVGAKLPNGMKIKKGKLRGEVSNGMLCSAGELGIKEDLISKELKDGIYILDEEYPLGKDIKSVLGLKGEVIDFEITPNRPDCLSIVGMARETAATLGKELKVPNVKLNNEVDEITDIINKLEVLNSKLCRRYYTKVVKNINVEKSPLWMRRRLIESNVRPINNIVDITNYVMLELGQPIHAFDLDKIVNNTITVRNAEKGEKMTTLDGVERELDTDMLVIADAESPIAIAGVMGGEDSEVTENTKSILIESANFDGRNVRLTSRKLGLRTEASAKFEKDLDPNISELACLRVCQLIEEIGAGEVVKGNIDIYENKSNIREIKLRPKKVNSLLGVELSVDYIIDTLNRLELESKEIDDKILVKVPTFRNDIQMETDLVEEIGRIYGFHNIQSAPLIGSLTKGGKSRNREIQDYIKYSLTGMGLNEITTYSFISPKAYDSINLHEESLKRRNVEIMNPLGEDYSVMRSTLIPNMLDVLSRNYKHGVEKAWAYEIGNSFIPKSIPVNTLPHEIKALTIGMYGETNFFNLKGILDKLFIELGIKGFEYIVEENHDTFHPGRCANILYGNHVLGTIGEIHPDVLGNYGMKERVYITELDLDIISFLTNLERKYSELPKYPSMTRDIAIVVDEDILVKQIEDIIKDNGGKLVEEINLFDIYQGEQIENGKKSVAYSIVYRSLEKTLTDEEVSKVHDKVVEKLTSELKAELRK